MAVPASKAELLAAIGTRFDKSMADGGSPRRLPRAMVYSFLIREA
ncbi:ClbS/DfsB family four-helix bundle protein [Neorhizobium sp. T6_25]|nr:ClbS/DfsB family four-helix bundle protein [Neorhizobium sp. T6_25]